MEMWYSAAMLDTKNKDRDLRFCEAFMHPIPKNLSKIFHNFVHSSVMKPDNFCVTLR